jgi:flavin-dependent dehydrogenase
MRADVVIVGAGTAGAAAAALAAERGLRVLCLEQRQLDQAGARWVNGVPEWIFREVGFDPPAGEELRGSGHAFHLLSGWGPRRLVLRDHGLLELDMRRLVERLQRHARDRGAEIVSGARVLGIDGGRLATSIGEIRARWFVDASGLAGARLLPRPRIERRDLCAAAQEVRAVRDQDRARRFFEAHGAQPGETLCFTGIAGGFSVVNVRLDQDGVSILTGSVPADGHPSGSRLLDDFVAKQSWIGARLFGGARAIPLRRPFDRLGERNVLLLGDAGCQVFSAHGSGIGAGLLAARVLAETLAARGDAHDYSLNWHRRWGGLFAGYEIFRRFSQRLSPPDLEQMLESGLLDEWGASAGLAQRFPALDVRMLSRAAAIARAIVRDGELGRALGTATLRMAAAQALYARYPRDSSRLSSWSRYASRVLATEPDPC